MRIEFDNFTFKTQPVPVQDGPDWTGVAIQEVVSAADGKPRRTGNVFQIMLDPETRADVIRQLSGGVVVPKLVTPIP